MDVRAPDEEQAPWPRSLRRRAALTHRVTGHRRHAARAQYDSSLSRQCAEARLSEVLDAARSVPYYRPVLAGRLGDAFDILANLPLLPRAELRSGLARFLAPSPGKVHVKYTSGTGGPSTHVVRPDAALPARGAVERRWYDGMGLRESFTIWSVTPWDGRRVLARRLHGLPVRFVSIGARQAAAALVAGRGDLILSAPEVLLHLATGGSWHGAKATASSYESLTPSARARLIASGAPRLSEAYTSAELCAPIAAAHPGCAGMHVNDDVVHVELAVGHAVGRPYGCVGRIVVTDLLNTAMPLLRYEIGDVGELQPAATCGCGRKQDLLTVLGRAGLRMPPGAHAVAPDVLRATTGAPFRLHQRAPRAFELVTAAPPPVERVTQVLEQAVGEPVVLTVREAEPEALPAEGLLFNSISRHPVADYLGRPAPPEAPKWQ